ncbi:hypothetical protein [Nostoc sp.]|uniref:hypothetical protein n=1 Tax=Nostoc sp. TaxID=1180 RepID=UPI002FFC2EDC
MIRVKTRPFVIMTLVTIFLRLRGLFFELSGDRMFLMEFKSNATTTIYAQQLPELYLKWRTSKADISNIPQEIFNPRQAFDTEGNLTLKKSELEPVKKRLHRLNNIAEFQGLLRIATAYDVWRQNTKAFSRSRWFYALSFVGIE